MRSARSSAHCPWGSRALTPIALASRGERRSPRPVVSSEKQARAVPRGLVIAAALAAGCVAALLVLAGPARAAVSYTGYIASHAGGTLTPFDTATNGLGATIAVNHPAAVAITPDGSTAWIVNHLEGTV